MSPVYHQLRNAGAMFGEIMGYGKLLRLPSFITKTLKNILSPPSRFWHIKNVLFEL